MKSILIECPAIKTRKLEACPICRMSPCQCGRLLRKNEPYKKRKSKRSKTVYSSSKRSSKRSVTQQKCLSCRSLKCVKSVSTCVESHCQNDYLDLCTKEIVNFCWLLLTPYTLNRLKILLHDEHGYSFDEAEEYIERKRTNVLNDLIRLIPFGCDVKIFQSGIKPECSNEVLLNYLQLQNIFEKLVNNTDNESRRLLKCSLRYEKNNNITTDGKFTPWQTGSTFCKKMDLFENICKNYRFSEKYDECFCCLKRILARNYQVPNITITTYPNREYDRDVNNAVNEVLNSVGNVKTAIRYPCRSFMTDPKSSYTIITSCCEPQLQVVKDQYADTVTCNVISEDTQTIPETRKKVRSQSVQTVITGKDTYVQTDLPQSELSFLRNMLDDQMLSTNGGEDLIKKETQLNKNDLFSILEQKLENKDLTASKEHEDRFDDIISLLDQHLESRGVKCELETRNDPGLSGSHEDEQHNERFEGNRGSNEKFVNATLCGAESGSNIMYYEAREMLRSLDFNESGNIRSPLLRNTSEYLDASDESEYENMRTYLYMNKNLRRNIEEDTKSSGYHTPPYDEYSDHVQFYFDFNEEEVMNRIFDLVEDEDETETKSNGIQRPCSRDSYKNAKEDNDDDMFQSASCISEPPIPPQRRTSFHLNRALDMSEIAYHDQNKRNCEHS